MKVIPIAATAMLDYAVREQTPYKRQYLVSQSSQPTDIDELAELSGRNCYLSWDRPNPKTATNDGYLANIISQSHFSVMEHGSVTFYVTGVSRSLLAELSRHRHLSFSVVSQRYVDANDLAMVKPPIMKDLDGEAWSTANYILEETESQVRHAYDSLVNIFVEQGYKRKEAREAARAVLPNMTDSPMVVTGNIRAWRDVLSKRYHIAADKEIQEFAEQVLGHLRVLSPNCVSDIGDKYGS